MEKTMKNLQVQTKANDVDKKGRVTVAVNGIGIEDDQGDISMPGSFDATLSLDINRMKWLKDHDTTKLLGVPLEGAEIDGNLVMIGQLNMEKQMCRDVYTDYKLMAEYGRTLEHSIGVVALRRDEKDRRKVLEWKMYEYSTLSFLGSNPQTFLVNLKGATRNQVRDAVEFLQKALRQPEYSDNRLKNMDMELTMLLKSLNGANIASCPKCGRAYDMDQQEVHRFSDKALEAASKCMNADGTLLVKADGMSKEEFKEMAMVIEAVKLAGLPMEEKSVEAVAEYTYCPHCLSRHYHSKAKESDEDKKPEDDEEGKEECKEKSLSTILGSLSKKINNVQP